jgi:hypothetical protein
VAKTTVAQLEAKLEALQAKLDSTIDTVDELNTVYENHSDIEFTKTMKQIDEFNEAYKEIFKQRVDEETGDKKLCIYNTFVEAENEINGKLKHFNDLESKTELLTKNAEKLTQAITEKSTFTTYETQAEKYETEAKTYGRYAFAAALLIPVALFTFQKWIDPPENLVVLFLQRISIITPLIIAYFSTNKTKNIYLKLSAEYRFKASLAESIMGYRKLHKLSYDDEEYITLFKELSQQLARNPSDQIRSFFKNHDQQTPINSNRIDETEKGAQD